MHIKSVTIKGFKSFRDLDAKNVEPFSPGHNVIVGGNGSGKSNFFQAIQFVLSDLYTNMRSEDRQHLIFDVGKSADTLLQAYVEIVFDNKDGRLPVDKEEVSLRRTIGLKKDEYYLDKKHVTKHDVINMLEAAGFSRSNPYYIVQQGRVNAIALMKDNERFELLKEVAGTRVYDERRAESEKIMQETAVKKEKVQELLRYIEERLAELESEKQELAEYQALDKDRRSLEFTIYDTELKQAVEKLARLEERHATEVERVTQLHTDAAAVQEQLKSAEHELKTLTADLANYQKEKEHLDEDRAEQLKRQAQLQLEVNHAGTELTEKQRQRAQAEADAAKLQKEVAKAERELDKLRKEADEAAARESEVKNEIAGTERRLQELYAKQGRKTQFRNAAERDRFLDQEIAALRKNIAAAQAQVGEFEAEVQRLQRQIAADVQLIEEADVEGTREQHDAALRSANELRARRDELATQRKELWRRDATHEEELKRANEERAKLERQLANSVSKQLSQGLAAVRRIVAEHRIEGMYGTLLELCEVPERFMTAVEITAGQALFHVVVDTDDTAAAILEHLNEEKQGRVSFMPLNRLTAKEPAEVVSTEAVPMLRHIKFQPLYLKAFAQVFGKTMICRDLDVASKISAEHNVNCVTLDGDQVNKSGGVTGGYYDRRASRLAAQASIREWQKRIDSTQHELDRVRRTVQKVDQEIAATLAEIEKQESRREQLKNTLEQLQLDIRAARQRIEANQVALSPKQRQLAELRLTLTQHEASAASLVAERGTPLADKLSARETAELSQLTARLTDLQRRAIELGRETVQADTRRAELELSLANHLRKKLAQLAADQSTLALAAEELEARRTEGQRELAALGASEQTAGRRQRELDAAVEEVRGRIAAQKAAVEEHKQRLAELQRTLAEEARSSERAAQKRVALQTQRDDSLRKIKELGPLPAEAFQRYAGEEPRELLRALQRVNEGLRKYSHVNKKALDQFMHFTEQRAQLAARATELDASEAEIRQLIEVLDHRKDEAIERTFKGVARHFSEVFVELVPQGRASLVMQRKRAAEAEADEGDEAPAEEAAAPAAIRSWNGVAIKVAFNAQTDESRLIQQLSGGQKSLVALAFLFAIQRCDRAPFYLFDEIDSALDPQHRAAVARLIKKESEGPPQTQFITITFKPELVQTGDRFYVVRMDPRTKVSTLQHLESKEQALRVLEEEDRGAGAPMQ